MYIGTTSVVIGNMFSQINFMGFATPMSNFWDVAEKACIADKMGGTNPEKCVVKK